MLLFIAEKPSMGRAIAKMLPGPAENRDGYIETKGGLVSWCIGHLLEQCPPGSYDPKYEKFPGSFDDLPIIPTQWQLQVSGDKNKQVAVIRKLLKQASGIVNAGDPGREGQLIIDELLEFLGNKKPVQRILLQSLDDHTIRKELANLHDNRLFGALYHAGLGRQRADWLIGMNMSRAFTILGQKAGYRGVLSVGRVQSPTLAIVVGRDKEIENFIPKDYWTLEARLRVQAGSFSGRWKPPVLEPLPDWLDEEGRIVSKAKADEIALATEGQTGSITKFDEKDAQEDAPLPFFLSTLQIFVSGKQSCTVKDVLDACQALYDRKLQSYPRTDCAHLPESQHPDAPIILESIAKSFPHLAPLCAKADAKIKSKAWNDAKLSEHHGIIPTRVSVDASTLAPLERFIFETISKRYLAQFFPSCEVKKASVEATVANHVFRAHGRIIIVPGWREIYGAEVDEKEPSADGKEKDDEPDDQSLPKMTQGEAALDEKTSIHAKQTKPPARFTEASLLKAMTNVHQIVSDPALKKKLQESKGIGREATRASIMENLVRRGLLERHKKQLISSAAGRALIGALPARVADPGLTALWETALDSVASQKTPLDTFMQKQEEWVRRLIDASKGLTIQNLPPSPSGGYSSSSSGSGSKSSRGSSKGKKSSKSPPNPGSGPACPKCKTGVLRQRLAKNGPNAGKSFLGCSNYPNCKHAESIKEPSQP